MRRKAKPMKTTETAISEAHRRRFDVFMLDAKGERNYIARGVDASEVCCITFRNPGAEFETVNEAERAGAG